MNPDSVWDMYNTDWVGVQGGAPTMAALREGIDGYRPAGSKEQAANFYGGPTWAALYAQYGPQTENVARQYGIALPGLNYGALAPLAQGELAYGSPEWLTAFGPGGAGWSTA